MAKGTERILCLNANPCGLILVFCCFFLENLECISSRSMQYTTAVKVSLLFTLLQNPYTFIKSFITSGLHVCACEWCHPVVVNAKWMTVRLLNSAFIHMNNSEKPRKFSALLVIFIPLEPNISPKMVIRGNPDFLYLSTLKRKQTLRQANESPLAFCRLEFCILRRWKQTWHHLH